MYWKKLKQMFSDQTIEFSRSIDGLRQEMNELKEKVDNRNDDVFTKMDLVYGEVKAMRDEQAAHSQQHRDINQELEMIKSVPVIAHSIKK